VEPPLHVELLVRMEEALAVHLVLEISIVEDDRTSGI
jgi:hypothetical protein